MADKSKIEWTDATWNPITGCTLVDEGCRNCYAAHLITSWPAIGNHPSRKGLARKNAAGESKFTGEVRFNEQWLDQPLRWRKPRRIFVCAHGDLFHPAVPDDWIDKVFRVMNNAEQHTFQVLTKRPERAKLYLSAFKGYLHPSSCVLVGDSWNRETAAGPPKPSYVTRGGVAPEKRTVGDPLFHSSHWPLPNVWLGTSVSDQPSADLRIPDLLATPAAVRFVSYEPALGPVDLRSLVPNFVEAHFCKIACTARGDEECCKWLPGLDWVICGGESGPNARPMHPDWARSVRDQCAAAGVPFLFKQWGEWGVTEDPNEMCSVPPKRRDFISNSIGEAMIRIGKTRAGRLLDGVEHNGFPGEVQ